MKSVVLLLLFVCSLLADVSGRVVDALGGELLARVRVKLVGTDSETATETCRSRA
jgi:hypothetical protein